MGRTSDQAKLLFFGLLRTVSALASTDHKVFPYAVEAGSAGHRHQRLELPDYTLRLARRSDVASIQRCNLATLPENYNQQFYCNHLRQWPELALVVECNDPNDVNAVHHQDNSNRPFLLTPDGASSGYASYAEQIKREPNIVAYVIGKVEEHVIETDLDDDPVHWSRAKYPPQYRTEKMGHVTSLAVLDSYRRKGLAQELMHQLHYHMAVQYGVESVGLHVRQSNTAADRLYRNFGYQADERIPQYYQDGEDAFLMKKRLQPAPSSSSSAFRMFGTLRRSKPWENGPMTLRLPRSVGPPPPPLEQQPQATTSTRRQSEEGGSPSEELLTGTM